MREDVTVCCLRCLWRRTDSWLKFLLVGSNPFRCSNLSASASSSPRYLWAHRWKHRHNCYHNSDTDVRPSTTTESGAVKQHVFFQSWNNWPSKKCSFNSASLAGPAYTSESLSTRVWRCFFHCESFLSFIIKNWVSLTSPNPLQSLPAGLQGGFTVKMKTSGVGGDIDNELVVQATWIIPTPPHRAAVGNGGCYRWVFMAERRILSTPDNHLPTKQTWLTNARGK